ncbi:MAG: serine/threonine-protein kinase [Nannocystales bacterium]
MPRHGRRTLDARPCVLASPDPARSSTRSPQDSRPLLSPTPPRVGTVIDKRYVLLEPLGRGASGWVWKAKHRVIGKLCAVKVLAPHEGSYDSKSVVRMLREATALSKVEHPGVVEVSDFGHTEEGTPFIVMELLEGQDLQSTLRARRLSTEQALEWGVQLLQAVAAAHAKDIVHRDIKPANIFVSAKDNRLKLLDFGLARLHQHEGSDASGEWDGRLTPEGELLGSPATMSPEQLRGADPDARSDMYSVGCVLYEMLAGRAPVQGRTTQVLYQHMYEEPPELREFAAADTPDAVLELVEACLAKEPEQRPSSTQAAVDAARDWRTDAAPQRGVSRLLRAWQRLRSAAS